MRAPAFAVFQEFLGRGQYPGLDDIEVVGSLHRQGKLRAATEAIKPQIRTCGDGLPPTGAKGGPLTAKNKAGRLPLTGPLLLS